MRRTLLATLALTIALPMVSSSASARPSPDRAFLQQAVAGDNGEITLGRLAQARAADPRVRDFGGLLVNDHRNARDQIFSLTRSSRIHIDARAVSPDAREAERRLSRLKGPEFDRMFVQHMVEDHEHDIAKFEQQAHGPDPVTARIASETLPHLRHHLEVARSLQH